MKRLVLTLGLSAALLFGFAASAGAAEFLTPDGVTGDGSANSPTNTWCETIEPTCLADQ
jgi:hypothetical protein